MRSGGPAARSAARFPSVFGSKRIVAKGTSITGPMRFAASGLGGNLIAVLAGRESADGIEGPSLIDLSALLRDGELRWDCPPGKWNVMHFTWASQKSGARYLVDGASRDSAEWYIRTVYQPHYDHFKDDFGKSIAGFFYDEPETHGDWGSEVPRVLAERGVDWRRALVAWKFTLAGEEQAAARYQYCDALAEAWGRTLYGGISRWCREHGVRSIGHFLEHGNGYLNPDLCAGNMFQLMKYSSMGGIDAVFDQFVWGAAGDARRPDLADAQTRQLDHPRLRQAGRRGHGRDLRRPGPGPDLPGDEVVGPITCTSRG